MIRAALIAHTDGDRVSLEGHTYSLPERQALTLSLVVNELVTTVERSTSRSPRWRPPGAR